MANKKQSKLFVLTPVDVKDEQEEKMEACYANISAQLKGLSENENHEHLIRLVSQNQHDDVCQALIYGILTNPPLAQKYYRDLTVATRDGYNLALTKVNWIIIEMFNKLTDATRTQLLWFIREAIRNGVNYMDNVCLNLLRVIAGGDVGQKNVTLAADVLALLTENRAWMDKNPLLVLSAAYCYLRLIPDHMSSSLEPLRLKEIRFCISLLRERWTDCMRIGRDLVRLLIAVARIPEFDRLWQDIINNPTSLCPQFTSIQQLLSAHTSRKLISSRVTVDMERRIYYLLSNVRYSNQKYYLEWLQREYLSAPESQSLRADWIRYICTCIHPTNEVLASDVLPRWSLLLWLMSTCTNSTEAQLCKLALFFDWLSYDLEKDSIMNIEPGILLMYNSLRLQPAMATSLLEFLCRITVNFCPSMSDYVKQCLHTSIRQILEKRVVTSMAPLFENPKLDRDLKAMVQEVFGEFVTAKDADEPVVVAERRKVNNEDVVMVEADSGGNANNNGTDDGDAGMIEAEFSDEDVNTADSGTRAGETVDLEPKAPRERKTTELFMWDSDGDLICPLDDPDPEDISVPLSQLDEAFQPLLEELKTVAEDNITRCDRMQKLLMAILDKDELEEEQAALLAKCLCGLFRPFFARKVFPDTVSCESDLDDSINVPFFVIFRNLCFTPDNDDSRRPILLLLAEAYQLQPRIGYLLLYFLKTSMNSTDKTTAYKDLCDEIGEEDLDGMLLKDLKLCQQDDYELFLHLVPDIYRKFSQIALSNAELMHLVVSTIDGVQLQDFVFEIVQGNLKMIKKEQRAFSNLLTASIRWETIEQYFFWQLVSAEEIPAEWTIPLIPKLEYPKHAEAMTNVTLYLFKQLDKEPTAVLVRALFSREPYAKGDYFTASNLKILIDGYEDKVASLIATQLSKLASSESAGPSKGKKPPAAKGPTLEQMLGHLDVFRQYYKMCHEFFSKDVVQAALADVRKWASEAVKYKFSELFAMMEILDTMRDGRVATRRGRKAAATAAQNAGDSSDEEQTTSTRATPGKKKRKVVDSDSD